MKFKNLRASAPSALIRVLFFRLYGRKIESKSRLGKLAQVEDSSLRRAISSLDSFKLHGPGAFLVPGELWSRPYGNHGFAL